MTAIKLAQGWGKTQPINEFESNSEISLETVPCPNCESEAFELILEGRDELTRLGGQFKLVRCLDCDLVLTNPRPTAESLGLFYPQKYPNYQSENHFSQSWMWLERLILRSKLGYPPKSPGLFGQLLAKLGMNKFHARHHQHEWIPFRAPGRLLDVGCGSGVFLERMQYFGWDVTGIEYAADVAHRVELRTGIKVHAGTLPHPELEPESFDTITMWHVLEHVQNPRETVRAAANLLRPGGLLVIEVPNIESRSFAEFQEHWSGLELPRHLQHFSPKTLKATLPEDQFRIIDLQQIGMRSVIKRSAHRAVQAGKTEYESLIARGKSEWVKQAALSEIENQGEAIRLIAERR